MSIYLLYSTDIGVKNVVAFIYFSKYYVDNIDNENIDKNSYFYEEKKKLLKR
jgi:hypothetical protein